MNLDCKKRRILIVNDDGIAAPGIEHLARLALSYGEVYVVAPEKQCSGMSAAVSITEELIARKVDYSVPGVHAFSLKGTPVDCAMAGCGGLIGEKPDLVLSGINNGYNIGTDILYSGTIGGAMQALIHDVPAIAFSMGIKGDFSPVDKYFDSIMETLLDRIAHKNGGPGIVWNVNFPECSADEVKGVIYGTRPAQRELFDIGRFTPVYEEDGTIRLPMQYENPPIGPDGTDLKCLLDRYISVGPIQSMITGR